MRLINSLLGVFVVAVAAVGDPTVADEVSQPDALLETFVRELNGRGVQCKTDASYATQKLCKLSGRGAQKCEADYSYAKQKLCFVMETDAETFMLALDKLALSVGRSPGMEWRDRGGIMSRTYLGDAPHPWLLEADFEPVESLGGFEFALPVPWCSPDELVTHDDVESALGGKKTKLKKKRTAATPKYPELARIARLEASVTLQGRIQHDGTLGALCVRESTRPRMGFEYSAFEAVATWNYRPLVSDDGEPLEVPWIIELEFVLHDLR